MEKLSKYQILLILIVLSVITVAVILFLVRRSPRLTQSSVQMNNAYLLLETKITCLERLADIRSSLTGLATMVKTIGTGLNPCLEQSQPIAVTISPSTRLYYGFKVTPLVLGTYLGKNELIKCCNIIDRLMYSVSDNMVSGAQGMYEITMEVQTQESVYTSGAENRGDDMSAKLLIGEVRGSMNKAMEGLVNREDIEEANKLEILNGMNNILKLMDEYKSNIIEIIDNPEVIKSQLDSIFCGGISALKANAANASLVNTNQS